MRRVRQHAGANAGNGAAAETALDTADLIDLAFDAIIVRGFSDRRVVRWNRGAEAMYGWTSADAAGRDIDDLLGTQYQVERAAVDRALATDGRWEAMLRQRRSDGKPLNVLARWSVHRDAEGQPDFVLEINADLSRLIELEDRLGAAERTFALLVSAVRDYAIFMLDPTGRIATWNEGAQRIKGYTAGEIIGRHFSTFYPEQDVRAGKPDWELVVAADVGRFEDEGWRVRKDGTMFWANVVITALRDETGTLRGFGKVTRDLTARRQAELEKIERERREAEALRVHATRLEALEKTKTDFLNLASHELRGPLAVARGYVSMLQDGSISGDDFLNVAPTVSAKLAQIEWLVQKMLETARLEYDQLTLTLREVDLTSVAREQVEAVRPLLRPEHRLRVEIEDGTLLVRGDRDRLGTIVLNLLDNAVKYSPNGGEITVKVARSRTRAFVSVADEGIGIDIDDQPRLFTRFTRLAQPEVSAVDGTGLGLFIARELARRQGGDIIVESRPGEGSRFTLSLAAADSPADRRQGDPLPAAFG